MQKIDKQDLMQINYSQFEQLLNLLTQNIKEYTEKTGDTFDLIVPILRSGAFTAMHIASKLGVTNVLPVQYKYSYKPEERIIKKFEFPKLNFQLSENANILIVDTNTVYGGIAKAAITDLKIAFPNANLSFASLCIDQSIRALSNIKKIFFGKVTNNKRELTYKEAENKGVDNTIIIYPWEILEDEWNEINDCEN